MGAGLQETVSESTAQCNNLYYTPMVCKSTFRLTNYVTTYSKFNIEVTGDLYLL